MNTATERQQDPLIGHILQGRFRFRERLDGGGIAFIYVSEQVNLENRLVAVKVIRPQYARDDEMLARFQLEAQLVAALQHPKVVTVYDRGELSDGRPFLVMEYVEGQTLKDLIPADGFPIKRAIALALQVAEALAVVHRGNVLHCDVNAANVMVGDGPSIKLIDFGNARTKNSDQFHARERRQEKLVGTPEYMAPEFIKNEQCDERVDLYGWAVLFYAMLCGKVPFTDPEPLKILQKQLYEKPPSLRKVKPEAPERLERLVMKALEKRPQRRQQNMDEVIAELERVQKETNSAPVVPPPVQAIERPVTSRPGRGLRLAGALGVALIIGGKISTGAIAPTVVNEVAKVPEPVVVEKPQKEKVQEKIILTPKETKVAELIEIARSRIKFGRHRKAIEYLDEAKRLDPANGEEHAVRRLAKQLSGVKPPLLRSRAHQTKRR